VEGPAVLSTASESQRKLTLPFVIPSEAEGSAVRLYPKLRPYE
jgi:hypothetical protein